MNTPTLHMGVMEQVLQYCLHLQGVVLLQLLKKTKWSFCKQTSNKK